MAYKTNSILYLSPFNSVMIKEDILINEHYPKALESQKIFNDIYNKLISAHDITPENSILGLSVCPDELNISSVPIVNMFRNHFFMGGLTGYPFSGITGMRAMASHVPDGGNLLLIYGPHIGISAKNNIGTVKRFGQKEETPCCGGLAYNLDRLTRGVGAINYSADDYEIDFIYQKLIGKRNQIIDSVAPMIEITKETYALTHDTMYRYARTIHKEFPIQKIGMIGGIIINTDDDVPDYYDLMNFTVLE